MTDDTRSLFQTAYYVGDVEQAVIRWNRLFGAGPFVVLHHYKMKRLWVHGAPVDPATGPDFSYALGYLGDLMIQFTTQHNDAPSVYRDMYRTGEEGFHHVAHLTGSFQAEVDRFVGLGFDIGMQFEVDGAQGAYLDTRSVTGYFTEIHSNPQPLLDGFAEWRRAHALWKAGDPVILNP
jgi:hypothetical protein